MRSNIDLMLKQILTVEPVNILFSSVCNLMELTNNNLYLQKACRDNITTAPDLDTPCDNEKRGVSAVASINSIYNSAAWLGMCIFVIFAAPWSDRAGNKRKMFIILSLIGQILQILSAVSQTYFWQWSVVFAARTDMFLKVVTGGKISFKVFLLIYLCNVTTTENRTMRIFIYTAMYSFCMPVSSSVSGFLMYTFGFINTYFICLVMTASALALAILFIKDEFILVRDEEQKVTIFHLLNVKHILQSFRVFFGRETRKQISIVLILSALNVLTGFTYAACRDNATVAPDLETPCDDEKRGISELASINTVYNSTAWLGTCIFVIFAAPWSDRAGNKRKFFIILSIVGQIFQAASGMLQTYFWQWSAIFAAQIDTFLNVITGGPASFRVFSLIYLCDVTTTENRTMRIFIYTALLTFCMPVSSSISGFLMYSFGFINTYLICLVISVSGLALIIVFVKDISITARNDKQKATFLQLLNVKHILQAFRVFLGRETKKQMTIVLILSVLNILTGFSSFVFNLLNLTNNNLYLQKACRDNATTAPNLDIPCDNEKRGVSTLASINTIYGTTTWLGMCVFVIFAAPWSDRAGNKRKMFIILSLVGQILQILAAILQTYFWQWPVVFAAQIDTFFKVVTGGPTSFNVFSLIYLCDVTTTENRTTRIFIFAALLTFCLPISSSISGFLMYTFGFINTYLICLVMSVFGLALTIVFVNDIPITARDDKQKVTIFQFLNVKHILQAFGVFFGRETKKQMTIVLILSVLNILTGFSSYGEQSVFYLYFRYRFKWNERIYGIYLGYKSLGIIVGTLFCTFVLDKMLKLNDGLIGAFAGFWDSLAVLGYFFATETWQLYLIPLLDIFHRVAIAMVDSFQSKFFKSHEMGQLFCVHQIFYMLTTTSQPAYNLLFKSTMDSLPNAFFLLSLPIDIVICILYGITYILSRNEEIFTKSNDPTKKQETYDHGSIDRDNMTREHDQMKNGEIE